MPFHAVVSDARLVKRLGKHQSVQQASIELGHTGGSGGFGHVYLQKAADRVDQHLSLSRNQHPKRRKFVFWQGLRPLIGRSHRQPYEFGCVTVGVVFPLAHALPLSAYCRYITDRIVIRKLSDVITILFVAPGGKPWSGQPVYWRLTQGGLCWVDGCWYRVWPFCFRQFAWGHRRLHARDSNRSTLTARP